MTSPIDFTIEIHAEYGCHCCGGFCCQECFTNPMQNIGDGQLLAFIDGLSTENKIFSSTNDLK